MAEQTKEIKKRDEGEKKGFHLFRPAQEFLDRPVRREKSGWANWFTYVGFWIIRPAVHIIYRLKVKGRENIPANGEAPVVFVANHASFADPPILWCATPRRITRLIARSNLWRLPVLRGIISRVGAIPVDPESADLKAVKRATASLKRGECIGIFAEGTRMRKDTQVYTPHAGFVLMAQMGKAKIVPVGITGTDRIVVPGKKLWRLPKCTITFGEAFSLSDFKDVPKAERTQAIVDYTMKRVFELRDAEDPNPIRPGLPPHGLIPGMDDDKIAALQAAQEEEQRDQD